MNQEIDSLPDCGPLLDAFWSDSVILSGIERRGRRRSNTWLQKKITSEHLRRRIPVEGGGGEEEEKGFRFLLCLQTDLCAQYCFNKLRDGVRAPATKNPRNPSAAAARMEEVFLRVSYGVERTGECTLLSMKNG